MFLKRKEGNHLQKPLTKKIQEFFDSRCDGMLDCTEVSPAFTQAEEKIDELNDQLKQLLNEEGKKILLKLYDQHGYRITAVANAGYQQGFSEGIKFILYLSIS
jgi:hypothetical protein